MKTLIRNFTHTFRRFFTASVLNIMGLAIAFAFRDHDAGGLRPELQ